MLDIKKQEEEILNFWNENDIFKKSLEKNSIKKEFRFFDGPPFATGLPHYGHIVASCIKDVIPRYKTMNGYYIERKWGWDCHGLPLENLIEKELGFKSKKDIEDYGVGKFNEACRSSVMRYADAWREFIPRIGRWVDMDNDYKTMDSSYMESVWWVFSELWKKNLVYENHKAMHICPRCETVLSNFEITQGYKDLKDLTCTAAFKLKNKENTYILSWTTTPWTLPGNVALAISSNISYILVNFENKNYIVASDLVDSVFENKEYKIVGPVLIKDLLGQEYEPLFDYFSKDKSIKNIENGWKIYDADFVTTEEGTGVVHIACAFGEDDMALGKKENLPFIQHVTTDGKFTSTVSDFAGMTIKTKDDNSSCDLEIVKFLNQKGSLFSKKNHIHSYPCCWRCDTPLLNYATSSWFVNVPKIKQDLIKNNQKVNWVPEHIKDGRFGKWIEDARDWAVSRSRFWGCPLPVWKCDCEDCKHVEVISSVSDIYEKTKDQNLLTKVILLRHGRTDYNEKHFADYEDKSRLNSEGKESVKNLSSVLENTHIDKIYSSPLSRCMDTVAGISKSKNLEIIKRDNLREINAGLLQGKYINCDMLDEINDVKIGETGESTKGVYERAEKEIQNILTESKGETIIICSHADVLNLIRKYLLGFDYKTQNKKYRLKNAEFVNVYVDNRTGSEFDLHKHFVDNINFNCPKCGSSMSRIPEVFDCWFESGSMPYAQNSTNEKTILPTDFIAEGQDQTRGWFYTLMVLGTALFNKETFSNVIVNGIVLAEDGSKMSKSKKNYPDPNLILDKFGADAVRYYLMSSPVVKSSDFAFSESGVLEITKKVVFKIFNVLDFYKIAKEDLELDIKNLPETTNNSDLWILSSLYQLIKDSTYGYENYLLDDATRPIVKFVSDLSNWYLRQNRLRFKASSLPEREKALRILGYVLLQFSKVIAPIMPFSAEKLYKELGVNDFESVHLESWPTYNEKDINKKLISDIYFIRNIISLGLNLRKSSNIPVKTPLNSISIVSSSEQSKIINNNEDVIKSELNIKEIKKVSLASEIAKMVISPNARVLGPKFGKDVQEIIKEAKNGNFELKDDMIIIAKKWEIDSFDCEIRFISDSTFSVASDHGIVMSLDINIDENLEKESMARELVSLINKKRAENKLSLSDKISVMFNTDDPKLKDAIIKNENYILNNVIATKIEYNENLEGNFSKIGDYNIFVEINNI
jgi:isoleucyl-tRNA synthetase